MAITTSVCNSFLGELLGGVHDLDTHTIKMALIKPSMSGTYNDETTNYSDVTGNSDEATGTNYSSGGNQLDSISITTSNSGNRAFVDIADEVFSNVTTSARGCIIYNSSASNKAIAVIDFGATKSVTSGTLTVTLPANSASAAIIRLK